jgi:hypothetical protein
MAPSCTRLAALLQASGLSGAWPGGVALDIAGAARRLAGMVGGPAVLGSIPGIAASHLVMDAGDGLFGLHQLRGHLSQMRPRLPPVWWNRASPAIRPGAACEQHGYRRPQPGRAGIAVPSVRQ